MNFITLGIIIIVNFIVQSTIIPYINILGVVPNTGMLIIMSIAFLRGEYYGGFSGLVIGLLQDIIYSTIIGINGFIYFFLGFFLGKLESKISRENLALPLLFSVLGTVYYHLMRYLFMFFLSTPIDFLSIFSLDLLIEIIYNMVFMVPIFKLFTKIFVTPSIRFNRK